MDKLHLEMNINFRRVGKKKGVDKFISTPSFV